LRSTGSTRRPASLMIRRRSSIVMARSVAGSACRRSNSRGVVREVAEQGRAARSGAARHQRCPGSSCRGAGGPVPQPARACVWWRVLARALARARAQACAHAVCAWCALARIGAMAQRTILGPVVRPDVTSRQLAHGSRASPRRLAPCRPIAPRRSSRAHTPATRARARAQPPVRRARAPARGSRQAGGTRTG
jgi:hypothetical protein